MNSGNLNIFQLQNQPNKPKEPNIRDQSSRPDYEKLYQNTIQLSNLLISMDIASIENIKSNSSKINENIPEITRFINLIIQNLSSLGILPTVAIGSRPTTLDVYNILCCASILLFSQKDNKPIEPKNETLNIKPATTNTDKTNSKDNPELDSVNKSRVFVLESEIQSIQVKYQGLNEECQKRRTKIRSLQAENNELRNQNESYEKEILKLKLKIEQLQIENETLIVNQNISKLDSKSLQINKENTKEQDQKNNDPNFDYNALKAELSIKAKENLKLNRALIEIHKELNKNSLNLQNETIQKNRFISIIQQQLIVLDEYERMYQSYQTKINKLESTLQATQSTIQHLESKQQESQVNQELNSDTLESLKLYFSTKSDFHNKKSNNNFNLISNILNILQNNKKSQINDDKDTENFVYSKIIEIFDFLFAQLKHLNDKINSSHISTESVDLIEMERIRNVNDRLSQYIMSMIQFFEHLANSAEMQGWMIDLPCNENLRPLLLSQCNKVENFVKKNQQVKPFYEVKNEDDMKRYLSEHDDRSIKTDDLLSLPSLVEKLFSDIDDQNKQKNSELIQSLFFKENEFLIILHLCAAANDALRRCAEHTIDSNRLLSDEIKMLRHEMQLANKDAEMRVNDVKDSLEAKIQEEEESLKNAENLLHSIQDELRRSESIDFERKNSSYELFVNKKIVKKCLALLNGDEFDSTEIDENYYYSSLSEYSGNEAKKGQTSQKVENSEELKSEIDSLKKQINLYEKSQASSESLEKKNTSLEVEKKKIAGELKTANQKLKEMKKQIENLSNENTLLKTEIKSLKHNEKNLMKENDSVLELTEEIESLRQKNEELSSSFLKEKKVTKKAIKSRIKMLKDEIEKQQRQNEDMKNNFDKLLADLRNKLKEATEINAKSINREKELNLMNKQLASELSTTKVDLKMLQMRINTIEERNQRDKKLVETQCKMKVLNCQTKFQSDIEKIKSKFECKIHNFQIAVVQHFKEFMNFRKSINEDSVYEVLDQVSSELKRLNHLCSMYELVNKDMAAIKAVVGGFDEPKNIDDDVDSNDQLLIKITDLVQTKNRYLELESDFQNLHKKFENSQNNESEVPFEENFESVSAYEWEQWARKVAALVSDNFLVLHSARELQFSIEESILGAINQRKITKRLEILRVEKKILSSGLLNNLSDTNQDIKINTLIILITAARKLQKISGHLPCTIPQPIRALEMMKKKNANKTNL